MFSRQPQLSPEAVSVSAQWQEVQRNTHDAILESTMHGVIPFMEDKFVPRPILGQAYDRADLKRSSIYVPFVDANNIEVNSDQQLRKRAIDLFADYSPSSSHGLNGVNAVGLRYGKELPMRAKKITNIMLFLANYRRADFLAGTQQSLYDTATQNTPPISLDIEKYASLSGRHQRTVVALTKFVLRGAEQVDVREPYRDPDSYIMRFW